MRKILFFILFLIVTCYATVFGNNEEEIYSLNGKWQFKIDSESIGKQRGWYKIDFDASNWDMMDVPDNWDTENDYSHYIGRAFYRHAFQAPEINSNEILRLRFEAVYQSAEVWLNGEYLGKHVGGYTPFEFDVTQKIRNESENVLVVLADNSYNRGAWWQWGGISRDVKLIRNNNVRILWTQIDADPNLQKGIVILKLKHKIENSSRKKQKINLALNIYDSAGMVVDKLNDTKKSQVIKIGAKTIKVIESIYTLDLKKYKLWHFDTPNLYYLTSTLFKKNSPQLFHQTKERFGIRKIEVKGTQLCLNGESIRVNGFNRVHDHRVYGNTEPDFLVKSDIDHMKELGGVLSRIMHGPQAKSLLNYCDEVGYLIIEEIPVWGMSDPQAFPDNPLTKKWLSEMIERDYNHPCIIGWSVANELADPKSKDWKDRIMNESQVNYIKTMINYINTELDPNRLSVYVSFSAFRDKANRDNEPMEMADIININCYGVADEQIKNVHKKWPDKPIFVTEYGKGQIGLDPNTALLKPEISEYMDTMRNMDYVLGTALWTYNDYRSRYHGTPPSENRGWGVVNVWRQPKRAADQIQKEYAPIRNLVIKEKDDGIYTVILTPRNLKDIPSFTLNNYQLKFTKTDIHNNSRVVDSKIIEQIKPGKSPIELEFYVRNIAPEDILLKASLFSSTGVEVYSAKYDLTKPVVPAIKEIIPAKNSLRIVYEPVAGANEYKAYYGTDNLDNESEMTINSFIDIHDLSPNTNVNVSIVAVNSKGESEKSKPVSVKTSDLLLPPIIWEVLPLEKELVVGYSVEKNDISYEIKFGKKSNNYYQHLKNIKHKGSYKINGLVSGETYYLRIKRNSISRESGWSEECMVKIK